MYWNLTDKERFVEAFRLADNPKLLEKFIEDFFTEKEIKGYELRLRAMCMISDGATYSQVRAATKSSPPTISRLVKIVSNKEGAVRRIIGRFKRKGPAYFD